MVIFRVTFVVVQSLWYLTLCNLTDCSTPGSSVLHYLLEFAQIHVHWAGHALSPSLSGATPFSFCLWSFPASGSFPMSLLFASDGQCMGSFSLSNSPNEYSGLISFRVDWFDLLAVQGTLKSFLQHRNSKESIFWHKPSLSNSHICIWLLEKNHSLNYSIL